MAPAVTALVANKSSYIYIPCYVYSIYLDTCVQKKKKKKKKKERNIEGLAVIVAPARRLQVVCCPENEFGVFEWVDLNNPMMT